MKNLAIPALFIAFIIVVSAFLLKFYERALLRSAMPEEFIVNLNSDKSAFEQDAKLKEWKSRQPIVDTVWNYNESESNLIFVFEKEVAIQSDIKERLNQVLRGRVSVSFAIPAQGSGFKSFDRCGPIR